MFFIFEVTFFGDFFTKKKGIFSMLNNCYPHKKSNRLKHKKPNLCALNDQHMNWEVINNERSSLQEYRLVDHNDCKVVIKYNPLHQSARITCGNNHRLFFFESAGSLSGKTFFKNEYGMEVGNVVHDKFHPKEGSVIIDSKKYHYHLENNPMSELAIFEGDRQNAVANCSIPNINPNQNSVYSNAGVIDNNCYLLGLCWYLFLPQSKENVVNYANA